MAATNTLQDRVEGSVVVSRGRQARYRALFVYLDEDVDGDYVVVVPSIHLKCWAYVVYCLSDSLG